MPGGKGPNIRPNMFFCRLLLNSKQRAARELEAAPRKPKPAVEYKEHAGALVLSGGLSSAGVTTSKADAIQKCV